MFRKNYLLIAILIVAAILRFVGTKPGYNQYHADEGITYSAAVSMVKNGNLDPLRYDYPSLVPLINYAFFKSAFIPMAWARYYITNIFQIIDGVIHIPIADLEAKKIFQTVILGERERNALFWGRYVTATISVGNVLLTYLLAKKLFGKHVALLAAFLLTFNFKQVINSHIGLPDMYNAFFLLVALLAAVNLWKRPGRLNYLLAGISVGLSFSIKYQIFAFFPFALTHLYISVAGRKIDFAKLFSRNFFIGVLVVPLVILILNPYHFLYLDETIKIIKGVSVKYGMGTKNLNLYPLSYFFYIDYGPPELFAVFVGLAVAIKKFTKKTLLFLAYLIPFMFMIVYYSIGGFYVRNFITTTPILMIFASIAIWEMILLVRKFGKKISLVVLLITLFAMVFIPGRNAIINSYNYTKPWGYDIMRPWILENLPTDVIVATHPFDASNLKIKSSRTEVEISGNYSLVEHKEAGASWVLFDLNQAGSPFYFWMNYSFDEVDLFWNKPLDIMRNMFHGIAAEELFRYQVYAVTKPWQAPDTHLLAIKLPDWPEVKMEEVGIFTFDNGSQGWVVYGENKQAGPEYKLEPRVGSQDAGSLVFNPGGARYPTVRITSPLIEIKEGHLYKIEGFLKTQEILKPREREGFIRVDFYSEDFDPEKVGIVSSVSSRVYGTDEWMKKEIIERAPETAKFLTVSFQIQITTRTKIWLDDVSIKESVGKVLDITSQPPYDRRDIDLNYVYPNSHGNL